MNLLSRNHKLHVSLKTLAFRYETLVAISLALLACSCGGGSSNIVPPPVVTVSISPLTASVGAGVTQQFTATVTGTTNTAVTWSVNNITGGNSTVGTISTAGLYTAPGVVLTSVSLTIAATSQADNTKSGSANLTLTLAVAVSVTPGAASLALGATQQFTATVTGLSNTAVTWSVNNTPGGDSTVGTVSTAGVYTAPSNAPTPNQVTVAAVSQADITKSGSANVTIRNQVLSIAASPAQAGQYSAPAAALGLVHTNAGARGQGVDLHWTDAEPSAGNYDFTKVGNQIAVITGVGSFRIHVTLGVINTTIKQVPADLMSAPFDSAQMETRFQNMLTAFLAQFGSRIDSIAIGNEADVYLGAQPPPSDTWQAYATFYGLAVQLVHSKNPSIKVGVTTTFQGTTTAPTNQLVAGLNSVSDLVMMNYYPLNANFTPRVPLNVKTDFDTMVSAAQGKPILLQEVGFPTDSTVLGSSEQQQVDFVNQVFSAWSSEGDLIQYLNFFLLHDATPQVCQQIANQFGQSNPNFVAFFCSLGLRKSDGTDKAGWLRLENQSGQYGFIAQP